MNTRMTACLLGAVCGFLAMCSPQPEHPDGEQSIPPPARATRARLAVQNSVTVDRDNIIQIRDTSFFPIGLYSVVPEAFPEVRAAGFNCVLNYRLARTQYAQSEIFLDRAHDEGLKVLVGIHQDSLRRLDLEAVREHAARFMDHPALLSWYLADEPALQKLPARPLVQAYELLRSLDPRHPVSLVMAVPERFSAYAPATDVMMVDPYPIGRRRSRPLTMVSDYVDRAAEAVRGEKPVWAVIQAFGYQNARNRGWGKREPTFAEKRCMTYLAIVHGARGVLYYCYRGSQYDIMDSPEHWTGLKRLVGELHELTSVLVSVDSEEKLDMRVTGPLGRTDADEMPPVHYLLKEQGETRTLIAVNPADRAVNVTFRGLTAAHLSLNVLFENRTVAARNGMFSDRFAPYAVHIYQGIFRGE